MKDFNPETWSRIITGGGEPGSLEEWAARLWSDSHVAGGLSQDQARVLVRRIADWALTAFAERSRG